MCGIVAAVSSSNIVPVLVEGLKKIEYRGYDSAGLTISGEAGLARICSVGRALELEGVAQGAWATSGIAHTRRATHGVPAERNAHPHLSGNIAVVHNGIVENYEALRAELIAQDYAFSSDTESIAHLLESIQRQEPNLVAAVRLACQSATPLDGCL